MALMSCCGIDGKDQTQSSHSARLDRQLVKHNKVYRETHRLLLLGAGESGKSTIVKQMQIINMQGFNDDDRRKIVSDIYTNLRDALTSMLLAMKEMNPPIEFDDDSHTEMATHFLDTYGIDCKCSDVTYSQSFFDCCEFLWRLPSVQNCYLRSNEYHLIDCAQYFLDRINVIREPDYMPIDQDILRCRILTSHIREIKFKIKDGIFHMFDVGGQRDQRRKWIQCFSDATAIVFVTSLNGYNLRIREDNTTNRLQESLNLFRDVWNNRFLAEVSVILFLNKTDLLLEKITSNRFNIDEYFPTYKSYKPDLKRGVINTEPIEFTRAKFYFRDRFLYLTQDERTDRNPKLCFPHFTCAVDTDNIRKIFEDCRIMIQRIHLDRFGILPVDS